MAYKFKFGTARLSGSTTFEEALTTTSTLSSSGVASLLSVTTDKITAVDCNIDGGAIDGTTIGASSQTSGKFTTLSASSTLHAGGVVTFGERALTVSAAGVLSGSATATLANATLDQITVGSADINGGNVDGAVIGGASPAAGTFLTLSASSTLQAMGIVSLGNGKTTVSAEGVLSSSATATITNATLDRITAPVLLGDMSGSGALDLMGAASFGNSRLVVNENLILGTANLHVSGTFFKENALIAGDLAANQSRIAYFDMKGGDMKTCDFSVYASILAGAGITATDGVLSVDTTGGDSMTATHISLANFGNATLATGMNYMTAEATGSCSFVLPSGSAGDVVIIKAAAGITNVNFIKISSSAANNNEIDGFSQAIIESPYGAVSLVYCEAGSQNDGQWVIY